MTFADAKTPLCKVEKDLDENSPTCAIPSVSTNEDQISLAFTEILAPAMAKSAPLAENLHNVPMFFCHLVKNSLICILYGTISKFCQK